MQHLARRLRELGPAGFTKQGFTKLAHRYSERTFVFMRLDLTHLPERPPGTLGFHLASRDDIESEADYYDGWATREDAVERLREGHQLFLVRQHGKIICFAWSERHKMRIRCLALESPIPDSLVYLTGVYTVPTMRGQGLAYRLRLETAHYWKLQGCTHAMLAVDRENTASLNLQRKLGYRPYQIVHFRRIGSARFYRVERTDSSETRRFIGLRHGPANLWKTFWE